MDKDEKGDLHPRYLIYDIIKFEVCFNFLYNIICINIISLWLSE